MNPHRTLSAHTHPTSAIIFVENRSSDILGNAVTNETTPAFSATIQTTSTLVTPTATTTTPNTTSAISKTTASNATTQKSVFMLFFRADPNVARPVATKGKIWYNGEEKHPTITYGEETEVGYSCSVTWKGELFIYGGWTERTQISKLNGCKLERIGTLPFQHTEDTCANMNDEAIFLFKR